MNRGFVFHSTIIIMIAMILFNAINYENINATNSVSSSPGDKPLKSNLNAISLITPSSINSNSDNGNDKASSSNDNNGNDKASSSSSNDNNGNDNPLSGTPLSLPFNSNVADQIKEKEKSFDDIIPFP
jgi:hypothetical protein